MHGENDIDITTWRFRFCKQEQRNERPYTSNVWSSWEEGEKLSSELLKFKRKSWKKNQLPYLLDIKRKLINSGTYAIIKSEV